MPSALLHYGRKRAESRLGRSFWILTADAQRLRTDPFLAEVLERPRVWVFGDEGMLEALLSFAPNGHGGCTP